MKSASDLLNFFGICLAVVMGITLSYPVQQAQAFDQSLEKTSNIDKL